MESVLASFAHERKLEEALENWNSRWMSMWNYVKRKHACQVHNYSLRVKIIPRSPLLLHDLLTGLDVQLEEVILQFTGMEQCTRVFHLTAFMRMFDMLYFVMHGHPFIKGYWSILSHVNVWNVDYKSCVLFVWFSMSIVENLGMRIMSSACVQDA